MCFLNQLHVNLFIVAARNSSRNLVALSGSQRGAIIHKLANLLEERVEFILEANQNDLAKASASGKKMAIYN